MGQQTINIGTTANDNTGDYIRDAFDKCNDNFAELYAALVGLLELKGSTDCSANPNYPAASKGDFYRVSVAGKIGGASGVTVEVGDAYYALADNAGGTQASVGSSWGVLQAGQLAAAAVTESIILAPSDETTALATGTGKITFRMPYAFTVTEVRASLTTAQTSGTTLKVDVNEGGSSILGANKLTFDNGQDSTGTAAQSGVTITTLSSIADASLADNAKITVDIDAIGDGTAKGLKVVLIGHQ